MKLTGKRLLSLLCSAAVVLSLALFGAQAAGSSSAVSVSSSGVTVGSTFTVTVKVSAGSIGSVEGQLTYDPSVVEFVSGSDANGTAGSVKMSKWATAANTSSLSFSLTFTAKAAGRTALSFQTTEVTDFEEAPLTGSSAAANVTVSAPVVLSGNANLASLKVSAGTLSPAFSANTTSYSVTVPNSVTKVTVSAVAADSGAKTAISGPDSLSVGTNSRVITVTAPNGTTKKYTVRITRQAAEGEPTNSSPTTPSETEQPPVVNNITVTVGEVQMTVIEDFSGLEIPAGFKPAEQTINNATVMCVKNAAGIVMLYLSGDNGSQFYLYNNETISFTPYTTVTVGGVAYILLDKPRNVSVPSGFTAGELAIGEVPVTAWQSDEDEDFYAVYLCGPGEYAGFYLYDAAENTLQRLRSRSEIPSNTAPAPEEKDGFSDWVADHALWLAIATGAVIIGLTVALILVCLLKGKKAKPAPDEEDFLDDLDSMTIAFDTEDSDAKNSDTEEES